MFGIVTLLGLFCGWVWFTHVMVSRALDHPVREAGLSAEYPAWGTPEFFGNCIWQATLMLGATSLLWVIPAFLGFWIPAKLFPELRGSRYWLGVLVGLLFPVMGWVAYEIFIVA
jgi:hypothetical protein